MSGLARLPTPIEPLHRLSELAGVEIWVKRDDLTGFGLSGNKVRKLDRLMADAVAKGADVVLTTGGVQSNHCRATAVAARRLGMDVHLLLRGERPAVPDSNLLLDDLLAATVSWCTPEAYADSRNEILTAMAAEHTAAGRTPYVIPEGGSNGLGALAFIDAVREVEAQQAPAFDAIICAVGSGGTVAGIALAHPKASVIGFAVCDDEATFRARVESIAAELDQPLPTYGAGWRIDDRYKGEAYGVADKDVWQTIATVARLEGIFLDPVYTGKAMQGLLDDPTSLGKRILFWHTGGAFGLFGRGAEVAALS